MVCQDALTTQSLSGTLDDVPNPVFITSQNKRAIDEIERLQDAARIAQEAVSQARAAARDAVRALRLAGASWSEVGAALGMSRQAAWEQFRDLDPTLP